MPYLRDTTEHDLILALLAITSSLSMVRTTIIVVYNMLEVCNLKADFGSKSSLMEDGHIMDYRVTT